MSLIDELSASYKYVCENSKSVTINYDKIDEMISEMKDAKINHWLDSNPFGINDMSTDNVVDYLLILHTIGYCFWGDPKWEIETEDGILDGSYAMMHQIMKRFKETHDFKMSFEEFSEFLKGNVEIPFLKERYNSLVLMNEFLSKYGKPFHEIINGMYVDSELLEFIIKNLDCYQDASMYDGKKILFYKRAQLITSDILHAKEKKDKINVDYSHLIGCADYKIPQVMRCYGMLEFDEKLSNLVDNKIPLEEGSLEEIEIRANTLKVIEYIYEKLDKKYTRMDINDYIWLLGQNKKQMTKPYHRTLTIHY